VTVDSPPQRIVTIKSTSTELVLALGLGDRIVGQAFADGPVPDSLPQLDVPVISDRAPSEEAVLELEPDFVFAGWESNLSPEAAGDRAELRDLGIASYVSPAACKGEYQPTTLSFDDVFASITEAGDLLGAPDAAADLVAAQTAELADITPDGDGKTALWWSSGTDTPYVGAGIGAPELVLDTVGLTNIAGDVADTWTPFNWEAVIAANPDVIVLVDASWNTAESKKAYLASNPATANLDAVKNERYLVVPFAAGEAGVRSVSAATSLAEQLAALR
jgi:iron complex transport system substrate-binding protein